MYTVLIATYNGSKYITEQLESVINQSLPPDSIYIYDDCSTDNTIEVISKWIRQNNILNIYIKQNSENKGYTRNFLEALFEIDDEYIFLCDQDDVWKKNKIEEYNRVICEINNDIPLLITSDYSITDENLRLSNNLKKDSEKITNVRLEKLLKWYSYPGMTFLLNRKLKQILKDFFNIEKVFYHDYYIALLAAKYGRMLFIHKSYVLYRQHGGNQVGVSGNNKSTCHWKKILLQRQKEMITACYICPNNRYALKKYLFAIKRLNNLENNKFDVISLLQYLIYYNLKSYIGDFYYSKILNKRKKNESKKS